MIPPETLAHAAQLQRNAVAVRKEIEAARRSGDTEALKKYGLEQEYAPDVDGISPDEAWKRHVLRMAKRRGREPGEDDAVG